MTAQGYSIDAESAEHAFRQHHTVSYGSGSITMLGMMKQIRRTQSTMEAIQRATMVMEMTPQGYITSVNANYQRFMGYDASQLLDHHHAVLCSDSYARHRAYYAFWQQLSKGVSISGHFQRQTQSGRMVWLQAAYTPILDSHGQVTRIIKIATPLSEQLAPVMAPPLQEENEVSAHAMATLTLSPSGVIIDANEQFMQVMGYTRDQLIGTPHTELFIPEAGRLHDDFWTSLSHNDSMTGCFRYLHAHGHVLSLCAAYVPVKNEQGQIMSFMVVGHHACISETPGSEEHLHHKRHPLLDDTQQMQNELQSLMQQASTLSRRIHHMAQQANVLSINSSVDALRNNEQGRELAQISQAMRRLSSHTADNMHSVAHDITVLSQLLRHASIEAVQPEKEAAKAEAPSMSAEELIQRVADTLSLASQRPHTRYVT